MQAEGENVGQAPDTSLARVSGFPHRRAPGAWLQCSWQARGPARHGLPPHHRAPNSTGLAQRLSSSPDIKVPSGCPKRLPAVGMRSVSFIGAPPVCSHLSPSAASIREASMLLIPSRSSIIRHSAALGHVWAQGYHCQMTLPSACHTATHAAGDGLSPRSLTHF